MQVAVRGNILYCNRLHNITCIRLLFLVLYLPDCHYQLTASHLRREVVCFSRTFYSVELYVKPFPLNFCYTVQRCSDDTLLVRIFCIVLGPIILNWHCYICCVFFCWFLKAGLESSIVWNSFFFTFRWNFCEWKLPPNRMEQAVSYSYLGLSIVQMIISHEHISSWTSGIHQFEMSDLQQVSWDTCMRKPLRKK